MSVGRNNNTFLQTTHTYNVVGVIHQTQETVFHRKIPNTEPKRVENTTCSGVFFTKFEVSEKVVNHCLECLIYLLHRKNSKE